MVAVAQNLSLVEINDFSGMLNLSLSPYTIAPNEARDIRNLIADPSGQATLRGGYDLWGDTKSGKPVRGIHRFYSPALTQLLVASGKSIYVDDGSGTFVDVTARDLSSEARTEDQPHRFATWYYKNECYIVNGADKPLRWDGQTLSVLPNAPVGAKFVTVYADRLWMANLGDSQSQLRWSALGDPQDWPATNYAEFSQPITGILAGFGTTPSVWSQVPAGQLWVFQPGRIEVLIGDGGVTTTMGIRLAVDGIGCVAPGTLATWGGYAFFLADDGVYRFDGRNVKKISRNLGTLFEDTSPYLRQRAWGQVADGRYWLSIPSGPGEENSVIYVYDFGFETWTKFTEIEAVSMFGTPGNPEEALHMLWGDSEGRVWTYRPDSRKDARTPTSPGKDVIGYWKTGVFVPDKHHIVQFRHLRIQYETSEGDIFLSWAIDSKSQTGSFTYGVRMPESSKWDTMLWDEGYWANLRQAEHVLRGTFPMRARGRSIELDLRMIGDGGVQSIQVLGYPVRRLR